MPALAPTEKVGPIALSYDKNKKPNTSRSIQSRIDYSIFEGNADFLIKNYHQSAVKRLKEYENPRSLLRLGDIHFSNKRYAKAVKAYIGALKLAPTSPEILKKIIACYMKEDKRKEVETFFKSLVDSTENPRYINDYLNFRVFKMSETAEDRSQTKDLLLKYISMHENIADFHNILGLFYLSIEKKFELAKEQFTAAIELDPSHVHSTNNLGVYFHIKGNYKQALVWFRKAKKIDQTYSYAYENIASSLVGLGRKSESYSILKQAYDEKVTLSKEWLGNLSQFSIDNEHNYELAIQILTGMTESDPLNAGVFNNLAVAYQRLHKYDDAISKFEEARQLLKNQVKVTKRIDATAPTILLNLVRLYDELGKVKKSERVLDELIKYLPKYTQALNYKARFLMERRNYDEAKKVLSNIIHIDPVDIEAAINLSYIYDVLDMDYKSASEILQRHLDSDPKTSHGQLILNNYAYALIKLQRLDEAGSIVGSLADVREFDSTKALYYLCKNDFQRADDLYDRAIDYFKEKNDTYNLNVNAAFSYYEKANYFLNRGEVGKANDYIRKGLGVEVLNKKLRAKLIDLKFKLSSI